MALSEQRVADYLAALGAKTPAPASGTATALTGALAAALAELAARFAGEDEAVARANALVQELTALADEDSAAYTAFMADRNDETRRRTIEVPEAIAVRADEAADLGEWVASTLRSSVAGDAEAAVVLGRAAARAARRLADFNR